MTNLDSVLKSRDIALPTKVHPVKAMVFPVVMCGCESWTIVGDRKNRRKAMTNLDSILKSRDITLPAKVHLVKAMVFPVVLYGCES